MSKPFDDDDSGLMHSLQGVRKLEFDRVDLNQQKPKGKVRIQKAYNPVSDSQNKHSISGHKIEPASEQWFKQGMQRKLQKKIRMGQMPVDASLDLHGYHQQQAIAELEIFFQRAQALRLRFLLIIHGKGFRSESQAKLRPLVQQWLRQQSNILAFCPAQAHDGGSGASYVYLKAI